MIVIDNYDGDERHSSSDHAAEAEDQEEESSSKPESESERKEPTVEPSLAAGGSGQASESAERRESKSKDGRVLKSPAGSLKLGSKSEELPDKAPSLAKTKASKTLSSLFRFKKFSASLKSMNAKRESSVEEPASNRSRPKSTEPVEKRPPGLIDCNKARRRSSSGSDNKSTPAEPSPLASSLTKNPTKSSLSSSSSSSSDHQTFKFRKELAIFASFLTSRSSISSSSSSSSHSQVFDETATTGGERKKKDKPSSMPRHTVATAALNLSSPSPSNKKRENFLLGKLRRSFSRRHKSLSTNLVDSSSRHKKALAESNQPTLSILAELVMLLWWIRR